MRGSHRTPDTVSWGQYIFRQTFRASWFLVRMYVWHNNLVQRSGAPSPLGRNQRKTKASLSPLSYTADGPLCAETGLCKAGRRYRYLKV